MLHFGGSSGEKTGEKARKQAEKTRDIFLTENENSVVPWNVNGTSRGEVTTSSERVILLTFVSSLHLASASSE